MYEGDRGCRDVVCSCLCCRDNFGCWGVRLANAPALKAAYKLKMGDVADGAVGLGEGAGVVRQLAQLIFAQVATPTTSKGGMMP